MVIVVMPEMYEIYQKHADRYDELVRAEDYENNLGVFLESAVDWKDAWVMEAGVGTGRITKLYIEQVAFAVCCDRSEHMLDYAQKSLSAYKEKLDFIKTDNMNLPVTSRLIDVFIEGWSFGHSVMDFPGTVSGPITGLLRLCRLRK